MKAADIMTRDVVTVHPDTSVKEIAETLAANAISARAGGRPRGPSRRYRE